VKLRFTPAGRSQFLAAIAYIHRDKPSAALSFRRRAETVLRRLERFPLSGRAIPEFPELPYREVIVPPYRIFYRVKSNTIWVVGVWHCSQLPDDPTDQGRLR
jgi:toxin ParE1/3/4